MENGVGAGKSQYPWLDKQLLSSIVGKEVTKVTDKSLQELWTGYGSIRAVTLQTSSAPTTPSSETLKSSGDEESSFSASASSRREYLVCKYVDSPPGEGEGHERDVLSYSAEAAFYRTMSQDLMEAGVIVPRAYHIDSNPVGAGKVCIFMNDLRRGFPIHGTYDINGQQAYAALEWLAKFHAFTWEKHDLWDKTPVAVGTAAAGIDVKRESMWTEGSYWRLGVRQKEFSQIGKRWQRLKNAAVALAELNSEGICCLRRGDTPAGDSDSGSLSPHPVPLKHKFQSLIHGDFKGPNIMFRRKEASEFADGKVRDKYAADALEAAAIDFQWVGGGFGVRDVIMLICSSVTLDAGGGDSLDSGKRFETMALAEYRNMLLSYIGQFHGIEMRDRVARELSVELLTQLYELCLLDYLRFMVGWRVWGNTKYTVARAMEVLTEMDGGECLTSEQYRDVLRKRYLVYLD